MSSRTPLRRRIPLRRAVPADTLSARKAGLERLLQRTWRDQLRKVRPYRCVAAYEAATLGPCRGRLEADHIWERSQGGPYAVENGAFLCASHHLAKTRNELQYRYDWLEADQVAWFAAAGFVAWDRCTGEPYGRGWRTFAPLSPAQLARAAMAGLPQMLR